MRSTSYHESSRTQPQLDTEVHHSCLSLVSDPQLFLLALLWSVSLGAGSVSGSWLKNSGDPWAPIWKLLVMHISGSWTHVSTFHRKVLSQNLSILPLQSAHSTNRPSLWHFHQLDILPNQRVHPPVAAQAHRPLSTDSCLNRSNVSCSVLDLLRKDVIPQMNVISAIADASMYCTRVISMVFRSIWITKHLTSHHNHREN